MSDVLESRLMRVNAALTFWKKQDFSQLLSYLLRTDDDSLFVDILPHITKRYEFASFLRFKTNFSAIEGLSVDISGS